ncbi:hypothetical protein HG536_0G00540 [Torulaspora globosa]|uniref:ATPase expression protein 1 n=1 Tax=Torulaspora globosa TaxID=48254 RepID=A0A7G3ZL11_9SACH|nr:uncharacterized protein HG536_0G00540 [Torulaspora globosa]QLL34197.1 hypothetical protein HG536_0G00540 [Torulaspora globosa]
MKPCRIYSTCNVRGVPRNPLKHRIGPKQGLPLSVPSPSHIVHPFYTPSTTEEIIACSTETLPALLDGKQIMPSLLNEKPAGSYHLEMSSLRFKCVRGVANWLEDFSAFAGSSSELDYRVLNQQMTGLLLKPSKLSRMKHPLISTLKELFAVEKSQQINPATLNAIVEQFISDRDLGVFSEDIYLYLLQHHVNSTDKILTIIESIKLHLATDIDQLKVIEELVLHLLVSLERNKLPITEKLVTSFDGLLDAINKRFHVQNCTTHFQPLVCEEILEYYIKIGNLNESKRIISGLIARKFLPAESTIVNYLKAINDQLNLDKTPKGYLRAFALVSDFRPAVERARNPLTFTYLIPLCRHMSEVTSLLTMIKNCENAKEILDVNLIPFIHKITHIKNGPSMRSANLCSLYRMASAFYGDKLPDKYSKAFLLSFADLKNYVMMATIMKKDIIAISSDFFKTILSKLEKKQLKNIPSSIEGCDLFKVDLFTSCMLPFYFSLPLKAKLQLISQMKTKLILVTVLKAELAQTENLELDVIRKILVHGLSNDLLSDVPASVWDKFTADTELNSVLRESEKVTAQKQSKKTI